MYIFSNMQVYNIHLSNQYLYEVGYIFRMISSLLLSYHWVGFTYVHKCMYMCVYSKLTNYFDIIHANIHIHVYVLVL